MLLVIVSETGSGGLEDVFGTGGERTLVGDVLTLVNALSYSFFLVISKRLLTRVDPLGATAVLLSFGSLGILLLGWPELIGFSPAGVRALFCPMVTQRGIASREQDRRRQFVTLCPVVLATGAPFQHILV